MGLMNVAELKTGFNSVENRLAGSSCRISMFLLLLSCLVCLDAGDLFTVRSGNWTDPATWSSGSVPAQGDNVLIDSSHVVNYDAHSEVEIRLIHIRGKLVFSRDQNTQLDVGMIIVNTSETVDENADCSLGQGGPVWNPKDLPALEVGNIAFPIPAGIEARIRLTHFADLDPDCAPGIICYNGRMDFHGAPIERTWTKIGVGVSTGSSSLTLAEDVDWRAGDRVIITRSNKSFGSFANNGSYRVSGLDQTEERIIASTDGKTLTFDEALTHPHKKWYEYTGEVALLNRNVIVESKDPDGVRGHTMYHMGSRGSISYAEFAHLGKAGVLARYPIHYHVLRDSNRGSSVIGASIWDSHNRFLTIHSTDYLVVRDCVGYRSLGHGFYMEDASEVYNLLDHNLSVQAFATDALPNQALEYDDNRGAGFWWANGRNGFINNVATECDLYGYEFNIKKYIRAPVLQPDGTIEYDVQIETLPFIRFQGNEVHGSMDYGMKANGDSRQDDPFIIKDMKIWGLWYSIRPDINWFIMDNVEVWNVFYGVHALSSGNGIIRNFTARKPGKYALGFRDKPEGLLTIENVLIDSCNVYPFRIHGDVEREDSGEIHIRNYSVTNTMEGWDGAGSIVGALPSPELTMVLHDWFGVGDHAKVIPATQERNDGLVYEDMSPMFDKVKVAHTDMVFPHNQIALRDNLPPATVITYPADQEQLPLETSRIVVKGTCLDASSIISLTLNNVEVTPLESDYSQWEFQLSDLGPGTYTIEALAVDAEENIELTPHRVTFYIGDPLTGIAGVETVAAGFELMQNYPNPFNPTTTINYQLSSAGAVSLIVYDMLGNTIKQLAIDNWQPAGHYSLIWDGTNDAGQHVASGIYFYNLAVESAIRNPQSAVGLSRKMILLK